MRFLCLIMMGCLVGSSAALGSKPQTHNDLQTFSKQLNSLRKAEQIPGLAVAVVQDNQLLWAQGYGYADSNNEVPVSADTPFWIASLTKTFVGLAYLHLQQQDQVNLHELAAQTPEFNGLCEWLAGTTIPFAKGLDCSQPITIKHILHHQVNAPVGTKFMYNPIMYSRLSRHLEVKFGEGVRAVEGRHNYLAQTIDKSILQPANMQRSMASMWDASKAAVYFDLADGFKVDAQGHKRRLNRPQRHIAGGAGVVSTAADLAKYDIAISNGTITPAPIKQLLLTPAPFKQGTISPYGFGWYFQCYRGEYLMWHSGWDPEHGYSALHLRLPERNLAFIVLANSEGIWWQNELDKAEVQGSEFAQLFLNSFVFQPAGERLASATACP